MIVVSDTSPLNYLILIDLTHLLPALFGRIIIPEAVVDELHSPMAPEPVRRWMAALPGWVEVRPAGPPDLSLRGLDAGEHQVIVLAQRLRAGLVLMDEARGRTAARERGLTVAGVVGVLHRAARRSLVDLNVAVERLQQTSSRASPRLLASLKKRR